ncbi:MAG: uroporphyrinogen-III C-methyltransferase [Clostridiales Family XIII bacterium]|jgi:uroporphyrinogen III methyltransferase/synthase|nr:uroporphyrinogen-III C-methyltransferase [Clostridiales Family XIII bacterium]
MWPEIRIGTRESELAVRQAGIIIEAAMRACPGLRIRHIAMKTGGDMAPEAPLEGEQAKSMFTDTLEQALLDNEIDLCVHSLKDMSGKAPDGLAVLAFSKREDPRDALSLREGSAFMSFAGLPALGAIGCSSARRRVQLAALAPEAQTAPIRGNVPTRIAKLDGGGYGGIVLAAAGLRRLGLGNRISRFFSAHEMIPAAGQGIIAVQGRSGWRHPLLEAVDDPISRRAALAEQETLAALGCGCSSPAAAFARISGTEIKISAMYCDGGPATMARAEVAGACDDWQRLAHRLAERLLSGNAAGDVPGLGGGAPQGQAGKVWLVGAGPGAPDLLTLRGRRAIADAETVFYDGLVPEGILAEIPRGARAVPVGKRAGGGTMPQEEINRMLAEEAKKGRRVVRLKGGDPFVFGRGGEEMLALKESGIPCEIVPGVSSAIAAPACAGIPVTHRGLSPAFHVLAWRLRGGGSPARPALEGLARAGGTLVALMCGGRMAGLGRRLIEAGFAPDMPAAIIEDGTTAQQRVSITDIAGLASGNDAGATKRPTLVVVGDVCALAGGVAAPALPLGGARIVVTRAEPQNSMLCEKIRRLGGIAIPFPCIRTVPGIPEGMGVAAVEAADGARVLRAGDYEEAANCEWLVFTSAVGVEAFFGGFIHLGFDIRRLAGCRFATVGPATAGSLRRYGISCDYMPSIYCTESLGKGLAGRMGQGETACLIRAAQSPPQLGGELAQKGLAWREMAVYDIIRNHAGGHVGGYEGRIVRSGEYDFVFFASASAVSAFAEAVPGIAANTVAAVCIGPETAKQALALGMSTETAECATEEAMCEAACRLFAMRGARAARAQNEISN